MLFLVTKKKKKIQNLQPEPSASLFLTHEHHVTAEGPLVPTVPVVSPLKNHPAARLISSPITGTQHVCAFQTLAVEKKKKKHLTLQLQPSYPDCLQDKVAYERIRPFSRWSRLNCYLHKFVSVPRLQLFVIYFQ